MMMVMVMMMMMEMVMITEGKQVVAAGPSLLCPGGQLNDISVGPEGANIIIVIFTEHTCCHNSGIINFSMSYLEYSRIII